jgi:uncharacterized membrane protein
MLYLTIAIVVWSLIHFIPATAVNFRAGLVRRLGLPVYKGLFALVAIGALLLIIKGWKTATPEVVFTAPLWGPYVTIALSLLASICFFAPYIDSNVRRLVRHPQLTGVLLWAIGHLLANGEARAVVLFGGFAAWALLEMALLNRRDGAWARPGAVPHTADLRLAIAGIGFFAIFLYLHGWLFGVDPIAFLQS